MEQNCRITDPNAVKIKELNDALIARSFCVYTPTQYILPSHRKWYDDLMSTNTHGMARTGHHTIRRCTITDCAECGIHGALGGFNPFTDVLSCCG